MRPSYGKERQTEANLVGGMGVGEGMCGDGRMGQAESSGEAELRQRDED